MRRTRIWHGIGSAVLVGSMGASLTEPATAWAQAHGGHMTMAQAGGEGGEGGEGGGAAEEAVAADPDRAMTANLLMMKGHLRVGDELVRAGKWSEALPHFLHPIEELYGLVRENLTELDVAPFSDALDVLGRTVKRQGDLASYDQQRAAVLASIDRALAAVPEKERQEPSFVGGVAIDVLNTAAEEYGEAFDDGRLANPVEYQDSRGFVAEAAALLRANSDTLTAANSQRMAAIMEQLAQLETTWPAVEPPEQPVRSAGEVLALVSGIELEASGLR
jgi:hypothetical protein